MSAGVCHESRGPLWRSKGSHYRRLQRPKATTTKTCGRRYCQPATHSMSLQHNRQLQCTGSSHVTHVTYGMRHVMHHAQQIAAEYNCCLPPLYVTSALYRQPMLTINSTGSSRTTDVQQYITVPLAVRRHIPSLPHHTPGPWRYGSTAVHPVQSPWTSLCPACSTEEVLSVLLLLSCQYSGTAVTVQQYAPATAPRSSALVHACWTSISPPPACLSWTVLRTAAAQLRPAIRQYN